ncbi:MAG: PilN domain-containing protein [Candidatus Omnitrophica bacterium]|nr:PilN domain-containing protein [Candidatus Omnitrophota bacterium]
MSARLVAVNLLPEGQRKPVTSSLEQFHRSPLAWLIGGGLVGVALVLFVMLRVYQAQTAQVAAQLQTLDQQKLVVFQLKDSLQALRAQQQAYQQVQQDRSDWAHHLNTISDQVPDGVWFSDLTLDPVRGLVIEGSAISEGGEEMVRIGRFVQELKADPRFAQSIQDIQIEAIKRGQEGDIELVFFTITCTLAPPRAAAAASATGGA